jgi:acetoin utilization deacetylase AcuC-like enzyme
VSAKVQDLLFGPTSEPSIHDDAENVTAQDVGREVSCGDACGTEPTEELSDALAQLSTQDGAAIEEALSNDQEVLAVEGPKQVKLKLSGGRASTTATVDPTEDLAVALSQMSTDDAALASPPVPHVRLKLAEPAKKQPEPRRSRRKSTQAVEAPAAAAAPDHETQLLATPTKNAVSAVLMTPEPRRGLSTPAEPPAEAVLLTISSMAGGNRVDLAIARRKQSQGMAPAPTTAIIFDEGMCGHRCLSLGPDGSLIEDTRHPERYERAMETFGQLRTDGLAAHCMRIPARLVSRAEVELCHERAHWDRIEGVVGQEFSRIAAFAEQHDSVFMCGESMHAARLACGSVVELTEAVMTGRARNGLAVVRPPGHHAEAHRAMGFCIFNNVAVAAAHARSSLGARRVLIVDWDIHHGNGIQKIFDEDPDVLYFSVHRFERGTFFPAGSGDVGVGPAFPPGEMAGTFAGRGLGEGVTVNVGWNTRGSNSRPGDLEYRAVWDEILMPIATEFAPDLVIIAAGFDAAEGDPLGGCHVTPEGYAELTQKLMTLANGRVVIALEVGYSLTATKVSAAACMQALLGVAHPAQEGLAAPTPTPTRPKKAVVEPRVPRNSTLQARTPNKPARAEKPWVAAAREKAAKEKVAAAAEAAERAAAPCMDKSARKSIDECRATHAQYWKCLREVR